MVGYCPYCGVQQGIIATFVGDRRLQILAGVLGSLLLIVVVLFGIISSGSGGDSIAASSAQTPLPTYTPFPTQADLPTYTPFPTLDNAPTYTPLPTYTPFPTQTPVPTATSVPVYTPTPEAKIVGCTGSTIRFSIGSLWANESVIWETGGAAELKLTVSPDVAHATDVTLDQTSLPTQNTPPYVVVGTVNAPDGTVITAWYGETKLTETSVSGGQYSLLIQDSCIRNETTNVAPSPIPWPTSTPIPPDTSFLTFRDFQMSYERWTQDNFSDGCEISACFRPGQVGNVLDGWSSVMGLSLYYPGSGGYQPHTVGSKLSFWIRFDGGQGNLILREGSKETVIPETQGNWAYREYGIRGIRPNHFEFVFTTWSNTKIIPSVFLRDMKIN